jgi:hypothetical protein
MRIALAAAAALAIAASAAASPSSQVARLSWLTGSWSEVRGDVTTRETWEARDGALVGTGETLRPGKPAEVERMKITAEPAGATFTAILPGQPPTPFVLLPGKQGEAVFENKAHDFPQRVIYRRCGADLCARIEGMLGGKPASQDWRYTRVK